MPPTTPPGSRSPAVRCDWAAARCGTREARPPPLEPPPPPMALPPPAVPAPAAAATTVPGIAGGGEITALTLPDGALPEHGQGATLAFEGQRLNFDCGQSGVDRLGLARAAHPRPRGAPPGPEGGDRLERGLSSVRKAEPDLARASEIALADGLTCRLAGRGATLAFEGRRASFTCGMKDGDTVALLGRPRGRWRAASASSGPGSPRARRGSRSSRRSRSSSPPRGEPGIRPRSTMQ